MSDADNAKVVLRLLEHLRSEPGMLRAAGELARGRGLPERALPAGEVERHILTILDAVAAELRGVDPETASRAADQVASDRAYQGIPMALLLQGYQAARQLLARSLVEYLERYIPDADAVGVLLLLDQHISELQLRMIQSYRTAERELGRTGHALRLEALRELLSGGPVTWAEEARLDPGKSYHCVVADVTNGQEARRVEGLLDTPDGISGIVHGYLCRVSSQLPAAQKLTGVLVVASPAVGLEELANANRLCRSALASARQRGVTGLRGIGDLALWMACDAYPELGRLLAEERLEHLNPKDEFHRLLAETARVYLSNGSRVEPVAVALHVHPNTVKYRLRRISELTGLDVGGPGRSTLGGSVRWWWALNTWLDAPV